MALSAEEIKAQILSQGVGNIPTNNLVPNVIAKTVVAWVNDVAGSMVEFLDANKRAGTTLAQGVTPIPIKADATGVEIELQAPSYWEFVDKGVNGLQRSVGSEFSFNYPNVSKSHAEAIRKWIPKAGIQARGEQTYEQVAYAIARSIKQKGIDPTPFVTNTLTEARVNELEKALLAVTGESIRIKLKNGNNNK